MWRPWRRAATNEPSPRGADAPPRAPAPRQEWRDVPPISRLTAAIAAVTEPSGFEAALTTRRSPALLEPLGHHVVPAGPSGIVHSRPVTLQRVPSSIGEPRSPALTFSYAPADTPNDIPDDTPPVAVTPAIAVTPEPPVRSSPDPPTVSRSLSVVEQPPSHLDDDPADVAEPDLSAPPPSLESTEVADVAEVDTRPTVGEGTSEIIETTETQADPGGSTVPPVVARAPSTTAPSPPARPAGLGLPLSRGPAGPSSAEPPVAHASRSAVDAPLRPVAPVAQREPITSTTEPVAEHPVASADPEPSGDTDRDEAPSIEPAPDDTVRPLTGESAITAQAVNEASAVASPSVEPTPSSLAAGPHNEVVVLRSAATAASTPSVPAPPPPPTAADLALESAERPRVADDTPAARDSSTSTAPTTAPTLGAADVASVAPDQAVETQSEPPIEVPTLAPAAPVLQKLVAVDATPAGARPGDPPTPPRRTFTSIATDRLDTRRNVAGRWTGTVAPHPAVDGHSLIAACRVDDGAGPTTRARLPPNDG